jgi:hypothetical protein
MKVNGYKSPKPTNCQTFLYVYCMLVNLHSGIQKINKTNISVPMSEMSANIKTDINQKDKMIEK